MFPDNPFFLSFVVNLNEHASSAWMLQDELARCIGWMSVILVQWSLKFKYFKSSVKGI
jgi:hypothetical protein